MERIELPNQRSNIKWTAYLAAAYAEGFADGEDSTIEEQLEGWACLIKTGIYKTLQGYFGRQANTLMKSGIIKEDGEIVWDKVFNSEEV